MYYITGRLPFYCTHSPARRSLTGCLSAQRLKQRVKLPRDFHASYALKNIYLVTIYNRNTQRPPRSRSTFVHDVGSTRLGAAKKYLKCNTIDNTYLRAQPSKSKLTLDKVHKGTRCTKGQVHRGFVAFSSCSKQRQQHTHTIAVSLTRRRKCREG